MFVVRAFILIGCSLFVLACGVVRLWYQPEEKSIYSTISPIVAQQMIFKNDGLGYGAYLAGTLARKNQEYDLTSRYYERALAQNPNNQKMKIKVYLLKALQGQFEDMMPLISEMVELRQPELLADYMAAVLAIKKGEYQKADTVLANKPNYELDTMLLPTMRAWMQYSMGNKKEAEKKLKELLDNEEAKSFYWYYQGLMALAEQNEDEAGKAFQKMAEITYPSLTALVIVRDFYQSRGLWSKDLSARIKFEKIITEQVAAGDLVQSLKAPKMITPEIGVAIALYDLSAALGPLQIKETSLVLNELSLYLFPSATIPKIWSGEIFELMEAKHQANIIYDRIENPSDIVLFKKAINLVQMKEFKMAFPLLKQLGDRNQHNPLILILLADAQAQSGNLELAAKTYETALPKMMHLGQTSELGMALFALGTIYDEMGNDEAAEQKLLESLRFSPNNPLALNHLGYMWLEKGKNESQAFSFVQRAHKLSPDDPHIMDSLALGYYRQKEYQKALVLAERSADLIPYSSIANGRLGDIYAAVGRRREALYQYRKALDLKTDITVVLRKELMDKVAHLEK